MCICTYSQKTATTEEKMTPVFSTLFLYYCLTFSFQSTDDKKRSRVLGFSCAYSSPTVIIIIIIVPNGNPPLLLQQQQQRKTSFTVVVANIQQRSLGFKKERKEERTKDRHRGTSSFQDEERSDAMRIKMMMTRNVLLHLFCC